MEPSDTSETPPMPPPVEPPPTDPRTERRLRWAWALGVGSLLFVTVYIAAQVRSVAVPLGIAFALAYIFDPVVDRLEARRIPRVWAIVIVLHVALLGAVVAMLVIGPQIAREVRDLPQKLAAALNQLRPWIEQRFDVELPDTLSELMAALQAELTAEDIEVESLARRAGVILKMVFGQTASLLASVTGLIMVPVFAFYLLRDYDRLIAYLGELVPPRYKASVAVQAREIDRSLSAFVRGQLIVAAILTVLYCTGFTLVGLPLGLVVGIVAGIGNMVPYLGTALGLLLATLMTLLHWEGAAQLGLVYGVFVVVQFLEGWVITPKVVGTSVGLSPFLVIVSVLVFGELFGFFGILVAVPLAAVLRILLKVVEAGYRRSPLYT